MPQTHFIRFQRDLSAEERHALRQADIKLYENGIGLSDAAFERQSGPPGFTYFHVVRLEASDEQAALQVLEQLLGERPSDVEFLPALEPGDADR